MIGTVPTLSDGPLVVATVSDERMGIAAAGVYALAYTVELLVGLAAYFGGEAKA